MKQPVTHGVQGVIPTAILADKGKWGEEMCDLVGNAARSGAITCVVSSRNPHDVGACVMLMLNHL